MRQIEKQKILEQAKEWFRVDIAEKHVANTKKLVNPKKFKINPFLISYLANYMTGNNSAESIARALILPRISSTSITGSFGTRMQNFTIEVLPQFGFDIQGSVVSGVDIEFIDKQDKRRKYCQVKAGPNTINSSDVKTIHDHFKSVHLLAKTNRLSIEFSDLVVGVLYGERNELSGSYKKLESQYDHPVVIGQEFWFKLTGDKEFYYDLISTFSDVAHEFDGSDVIEETVKALAASDIVQKLAGY